jgi:hypothetical protein
VTDTLELELRQLPGVCGVGVDDEEGRLVVTVCVEPDTEIPNVRHRAEPLARAHADGDVALTIIELSGAVAAARAERVRLLRVQMPSRSTTGDYGEVEVHLGWRGRRTIERAAASIPAIVDATVKALGGFGHAVPYHHRWSQEVGPTGDRHTVAIGLGGGGSELYGMAAGVSREEAAVRATLSALNRLLEVTESTADAIDMRR